MFLITKSYNNIDFQLSIRAVLIVQPYLSKKKFNVLFFQEIVSNLLCTLYEFPHLFCPYRQMLLP